MHALSFHIILPTILALFAFAGNSVLCRLALGNQTIDAASFTAIRMISGIVMLGLILIIRSPKTPSASKGSWPASLMLMIYAVAFSYAYVSLETGTGALILFGAVQITMILVNVFSRKKLNMSEWLGILLAFSGFVYLVLPSLSTPSFTGFILMTLAGIAWGFYTLMGRGSKAALQDTTYNFLRTLPIAILLIILSFDDVTLSNEGILLAVLSGAVASGIGYTLWYMALAGLTSIQAGVLQLLVPIIATLGGVVFLNEMVTLRMLIATVMVLGGIFLVIMGKSLLMRFKHIN